MQEMKPHKQRGKRILWICAVLTAVAALGTVLWIRQFHNYTPAEVLKDLRAAAGARHAPRPVERYLELRYGPLTDPANRQRAFLDFFNQDHIKALHLIVNHMGNQQRQTNIAAMAQWIADYRATMSREEKQALADHLSSVDGKNTLRRATAQYLQQDVYYRANTSPVILELMTTLNAVQQQ